MARMLGLCGYDGLFCHCCNKPRTHHHQRQREKRAVRNWRAEYEDPDDVIERACPKGGPDCGCWRSNES